MSQFFTTVSTPINSSYILSTENNSRLTTEVNGGIYRDIPSTFWIFLSVETIVIILANTMLCWLFMNNRKLQTQQNYFVLSLSISDLLVGLSVAPCEYCALKYPQYQGSDCPLFCGSVVSFNMLASTINLVLIAADRYCSINKPFRYQEVLSKRRVVIIILMAWLMTLILTVLPLSWALNPTETAFKINLYFALTLFAIIIVIGVGLLFVYINIVRTIQKKIKSTPNERSSNPAGIKVCIMVAISFFTCWIPTCIVEVLLQLNNIIPSYIVMPTYIFNASYFILLLNPCLDPLMYAYYRRDFRHELASWSRAHWKRVKNIYDIFAKKSNKKNKDVYKSNDRYNNNYSVKALLPTRERTNTHLNSVVIDRTSNIKYDVERVSVM